MSPILKTRMRDQAWHQTMHACGIQRGIWPLVFSSCMVICVTLHDENRMYKVICFETLVDKNVEDTTKISSMYGGMNFLFTSTETLM